MNPFAKLRALRYLSILAFQLFSIFPLAAILDTNTNGMSDLWEKQHNNGNLFPASFLPSADDDKDGWDNVTEAVAGTDPFQPNPPNGIIATTIEPTGTEGAFTLTWPTIVGKNYRLQASFNLTNWLNVGSNIEGTTNTHTLGISAVQPDTTVPPKLFWRIVATDLDSDGDGLTNAEENALGTDPNSANSIPSITDLWLAKNFIDDLLTIGLSAIIANPDTDGDGSSNIQEEADGTDPKKSDTDDDGLLDSVDADPHDAVVNWQKTGRPNFAVIEIAVTNTAELTYYDHSPNGTILLGRPVENSQPTAVIIDKQQNVDEIPRTMVNGVDEGIWLTHLHDDLVPALNNTATSDDSLYDPITNSYQPWNCPTNYQDMICDVRDGLVIGRFWQTIPGDDLIRYSPQGEALPGQGSQGNAPFAYIDKDANITSETHYWYKQADGSYAALQYPGSPDLPQAKVACASLSQIIGGVEKKWSLVTRSGTNGLLISANGGAFQNATKRFGGKKFRAVTRQGWIFDEQFKVWTGQEWQTLLEILGTDYTHAELLGINDEGLAVAKITKTNQPMKIGLLVPVEIVPDANMIGVLGDVVKSVKPDSTIKHFVTPKQTAELAQEYIELKAVGVNPQTFNQLFEWEGGLAGSSPEKRKVKRDVAGKTEIIIKAKQGGAIAAKMYVWCVWATMTARIEGDDFSPNNDLKKDEIPINKLGKDYIKTNNFIFDNGIKVDFNEEHFTTNIEWKSAISPISMFDLAQDVPDLTEMVPKDQKTLLQYDGGRTYYTRWDIPRNRKKIMLYDDVTIIHETDWEIDDDSNFTRDEDPYEQPSSSASAEIFSFDGPGCGPYKKYQLGQYIGEAPPASTQVQIVNHVFQEWTRVRIADKWYDISEKQDWWSKIKIIKVDGVWTSDKQDIGIGIEQSN